MTTDPQNAESSEGNAQMHYHVELVRTSDRGPINDMSLTVKDPASGAEIIDTYIAFMSSIMRNALSQAGGDVDYIQADVTAYPEKFNAWEEGEAYEVTVQNPVLQGFGATGTMTACGSHLQGLAEILATLMGVQPEHITVVHENEHGVFLEVDTNNLGQPGRPDQFKTGPMGMPGTRFSAS